MTQRDLIQLFGVGFKKLFSKSNFNIDNPLTMLLLRKF